MLACVQIVRKKHSVIVMRISERRKTQLPLCALHSFEKAKADNSSFGDFHVFFLDVDFHAPALKKKKSWGLVLYIFQRQYNALKEERTFWGCSNLGLKQP